MMNAMPSSEPGADHVARMPRVLDQQRRRHRALSLPLRAAAKASGRRLNHDRRQRAMHRQRFAIGPVFCQSSRVSGPCR
jgi:hypothetical protein